MLANACNKLAADKSCEQLIVKIARHILNASKPTDRNIQLVDFELHHFAILANACSKVEKDPSCQQLIVKIADHILNASKPTNRSIQLVDFEPQHFAMLANACSKLAADKSCEQLIVKLLTISSTRLNRPIEVSNWLILSRNILPCWLTPAANWQEISAVSSCW